MYVSDRDDNNVLLRCWRFNTAYVNRSIGASLSLCTTSALILSENYYRLSHKKRHCKFSSIIVTTVYDV